MALTIAEVARTIITLVMIASANTLPLVDHHVVALPKGSERRVRRVPSLMGSGMDFGWRADSFFRVRAFRHL